MDKPQTTPSTDLEVKTLAEIYDMISALDYNTQCRMLNWLKERLSEDERKKRIVA